MVLPGLQQVIGDAGRGRPPLPQRRRCGGVKLATVQDRHPRLGDLTDQDVGEPELSALEPLHQVVYRRPLQAGDDLLYAGTFGMDGGHDLRVEDVPQHRGHGQGALLADGEPGQSPAIQAATEWGRLVVSQAARSNVAARSAPITVTTP